MDILRSYIITFIFLIGLSNAMIRPIIEHTNEFGIYSGLLNGFGISFIVWFAIYCCIDMLSGRHGEILNTRDLIMITMTLIGLCIPSAFISWVVLSFFAGYCSICMGTHGSNIRNASFIMMALALRVPISDICLKLSADAFLQFDTMATLSIIQNIDPSITRQGNILIGPQGHELLIMTGCASFTNISLALLLWFTIMRTYITQWRPHLNLYIIPLCVLVMGLNIFRLSMMSLSVDLYHFYHDELGADIINFAMVLLTLAISFGAIFVEKNKKKGS